MDVCEFLYTYINAVVSKPKRAVGIEKQSWKELKHEMNRTESGYSCEIYFKTTSFQGQKLFTVVNDDSVFYLVKRTWFACRTGCNSRFGRMKLDDSSLSRTMRDDTSVNWMNMHPVEFSYLKMNTIHSIFDLL